ncbi:hypothetical protein [Streptomyces cremeus]|uniref:Secreted protein n=1 Tax=Streptomyces cremeus TaxID=66881 RepID=A0ABV5PC97_STRCM
MPAHRGRAVALVLPSLLLAAGAGTAAVHTAPPGGRAPAAHAAPDRFGAVCRTAVERTRAVAYCHNPYPDTDLVRLHTECAHWWDLDGDSAPVEVGPAQTVRLSSRCWKEVGSAWVTHERAPEPPPPLTGARSR